MVGELSLCHAAKVIQGELSVLWEKYMGNNKSIFKCAVPRNKALRRYRMIKCSPTMRGE